MAILSCHVSIKLPPKISDGQQFFFNHRPLGRSHRPEPEGKTPAQLLTGQLHPHRLHAGLEPLPAFLSRLSVRRQKEPPPSRHGDGPYCYLKNPGFEPCPISSRPETAMCSWVEVYGEGGFDLRQPAHGQRPAHLQRVWLRLCRREGPDHQGLVLPRLRGALELRLSPGDAPLRPLRPRQGDPDRHRRDGWIVQEVLLAGYCSARMGAKIGLTLPPQWHQAPHRPLARRGR